jgi:putative FmdB family regulatory protein
MEKENCIMPIFEYECQSCGNEFALELSMAEHERKEKDREIRCPKCKSENVRHLMESVFVTTSKKS